MGGNGFAPKPTALRLLEGNARQKRLNDREPKPRILLNVEPPDDFDSDQKQIWKSLAQEMVRIGLLTEIDIYPLYRYVKYMAKYIELSKLLTSDRMLIQEKDSQGKTIKVKANPLFALMNECSNQCSRLEHSLGLSPSGRSRIIAGIIQGNLEELNSDPYSDDEDE